MSNFYTKLLEYRYERKYVTNLDEKTLELVIKTHPLMFSEVYNQRFINNLYFDTENLDFFYNNINGKNERNKVRIRWYGNLFGTVDNPILEIKIKNGYVNTKKSFFLDNFEFNINSNISLLIKSINLPAETRDLFKLLKPTLVNRYQRRYFTDACKKFRITLDTKISFFHPTALSNNFVFSQNIIELKYNFENDFFAMAVSDNLPFRLSKNSKYVEGIKMFYNIID